MISSGKYFDGGLFKMCRYSIHSLAQARLPSSPQLRWLPERAICKGMLPIKRTPRPKQHRALEAHQPRLFGAHDFD